MENEASGGSAGHSLSLPTDPTVDPTPSQNGENESRRNMNLPWPEPMRCERHQTEHKSHAVQNWCFGLSQ